MPYEIRTTYDERYSLKAFLIPDDPLTLYRKEARHSAKNGKPIPDGIAPRGFHAKSRQKAAPDYFHLNGELMVSERFKRLLESLEPNVHQFFPVNGYHPDTGEPRTLECYLFNCCNLVERSFVEPQEGVYVEESQVTSDGNIARLRRQTSDECEGEYWRYQLESAHRGGYLIRPEVIGNRHFWIEKHSGTHTFVSDEFMAALIENDIKAALCTEPAFFPLEGKDHGGAS